MHLDMTAMCDATISRRNSIFFHMSDSISGHHCYHFYDSADINLPNLPQSVMHSILDKSTQRDIYWGQVRRLWWPWYTSASADTGVRKPFVKKALSLFSPLSHTTLMSPAYQPATKRTGSSPVESTSPD